MLTKSIFRLKTYTAVLLISMIIFSMSIPLSITLAKSYGETRAQQYAYLIRPHAQINVYFSFQQNPPSSFQALYYILRNENTSVTLRSVLELLEYINNQTTIKWLNEQSNNPVLENNSGLIYSIYLGDILCTRTELLNLTGLNENAKNVLLREKIERLMKEFSNELRNRYEKITGENIENRMDIFVDLSLLPVDQNYSLIIARYRIPLYLTIYSDPHDLTMLGFNLSKTVSRNTIVVEEQQFNALRVAGVITSDNRLKIGNSTFSVVVLKKDTTSSEYYDIGFFRLGATLYVPKEYFKQFILTLYHDEEIYRESFLYTILFLPDFTTDNLKFATNLGEILDGKTLVSVFPSIILLNGFADENISEKIQREVQNLNQYLINLEANETIVTLFVNTSYSIESLQENLMTSDISSMVLINYNATFIYTSSFSKTRITVGSLYDSLLEKYENLTNYIETRLNELGTDKPPYSYLAIEAPGTVTGEYVVTYPYGGGEPYSGSTEDPMKSYYVLQGGEYAYGIWLRLENDKLYQLVSLRSQTWDPIGAMSLASLIPIVLMVGYFTLGESLETIFATSRKWLATSVARGAYLKKFITRLKLLFVILAVIIAIIGVGLSGVFISLTISPGYSLLYLVKSLYSSYLTLAPTLLLVPLVMFISARGKLSRLETLSPLESQRPVESVAKHAKSRRRTVGALFLIIIVAISLVLGLTRPDVEHMFDELADRFGGAGVAIFAMIIFSGIMISPFSPLIVLYYSITLMSNNDKLFDYIDRLAARLIGRSPHGELSVKSSWRLKELLRGPTRTAIVSLSVVFGTLFARGGLLHYLYPWLNETRLDASLISGLFSATRVLLLVGIIGAATLVLIYPIVLSRTFDYIKGHVAIMRARGGDKKTIITYVYGSFLPSIIFLVLASLLGGLMFVVSMDSVIGIAFIDYWENENYNIPHLLPWSDIEQIFLLLGIIAFLFLLPVFLAYRVAAVRDLAKYLREEVF